MLKRLIALLLCIIIPLAALPTLAKKLPAPEVSSINKIWDSVSQHWNIEIKFYENDPMPAAQDGTIDFAIHWYRQGKKGRRWVQLTEAAKTQVGINGSIPSIRRGWFEASYHVGLSDIQQSLVGVISGLAPDQVIKMRFSLGEVGARLSKQSKVFTITLPSAPDQG